MTKPKGQVKSYQRRFFRFLLELFFPLQANDLEETIKRIQGHKGVVGVMIVNQDGKSFLFQFRSSERSLFRSFSKAIIVILKTSSKL